MGLTPARLRRAASGPLDPMQAGGFIDREAGEAQPHTDLVQDKAWMRACAGAASLRTAHHRAVGEGEGGSPAPVRIAGGWQPWNGTFQDSQKTRVPRRQRQGHTRPALEPSLRGRAPVEGSPCQQCSEAPAIQAERNRQAEPDVRGKGTGGLSTASQQLVGRPSSGRAPPLCQTVSGGPTLTGTFPARMRPGTMTPH